MKKHTWKIVFAVAAVLMIGSVLYGQYASNKANSGVTLEEHVRGNPEASVVLTEYADFQCPACGQFHPVMKSLVEQYGDRVRFEFKHFPLLSIHPYALPAAKAAEAAGVQGKFFEMHDKLFENQDAWSKSGTPQIFFVQYAEELGLDVDLFKQHMRASMVDDAIKAQYHQAQGLGLTGTPSFFLNGELMEFETFDQFIGALEAALGITPTAATSSATSENTVEFGI